MELIDIITSILIYGGGVVTVLIIVSYLFAKSKEQENPIITNGKNVIPQYSLIKKKNVQNVDQVIQRQNSTQQQPIIFRFEKNKELKIVRKSTYDSRTNESKNDSIRKTNGKNGTRYTIVNETMEKNKKINVVNF
ncbi:MAG: hypothetical protein FJ214_08395 [Ignavibacteria bacterium]|nr:hypothetical protein [Ignavibacteria bacterium]